MSPSISPYFWALLGCSMLPVYRSWGGYGDLRPHLIDILVFVQAGSQAVRERRNLSEQTGIDAATIVPPPPSVQSSEDTESVDLEQREAFSEWSTGIVYNHLTDDKIRILQVVPDVSAGTEELHFTLIDRPLSDLEGQYIAVSYYWGKHTRERKCIYINGHKAFVTRRLYDTLLEVCHHCNMPFWVDALGINQSDLAERSAQVLRMKAIYGRAKEVVACLGTEDDDEHCSQMMGFLNSISMDGQEQVEFPAYGKASFDDLKALVRRPYWRRVWIIQEIAAARKVSLLACGQRVPLEKLSHLLAHVDKQPPHQTEWPEFNRDLQLVRQILEIRARRINNKPLQLLQILANTQRSLSTIPHDKVFGLLSLTTDGPDFVAEPDYKIPETEVCMRMTRSFIESRQNLDIILAGSRNPEDSPLPSWCPDYLRIANTPLAVDDNSFVKYLSGEDKCHRLGKEGIMWETTGGRNGERRVNVEFRDSELGLRGLRIGKISGLGATGHQSTASAQPFILTKQDTSLTKTRPSLPNHAQRPSSEVKRGYSTYDGLCRMLLIYDSHYAEFTKSPIVLGMLYNIGYLAYAAVGGTKADIVWNWLKKNRNLFIHGKSLRDRAFYSWDRVSHNFLAGFFKLNAKTMTVWHYRHITESVARIITQNLSLMSTFEGEVGWVEPCALPDDEIFLFQGCSLCVVLRPLSKDPRMASAQKLSTPTPSSSTRHRPSDSVVPPPMYRIIGHAIVDGYMDGQRWASTDSHKLMDITVV
ncbi:hypothetical protein A1O3_06384 [Capronia epimyces CBS 606.96]|uniref:Heterokaryon incompatibility domain-containing protein n=1 Tax=Capronia epimyces CBS 606.96 TaxID=1182542 RepID=W9Y011_9EURO|nr:uncharacterized protein A1O3_06384 [Capronia epimyces CBS 606.96]EXJ82571.1 hypothetical protein A1O3_06384 [Capronia epimyces CBS 606.96]